MALSKEVRGFLIGASPESSLRRLRHFRKWEQHRLRPRVWEGIPCRGLRWPCASGLERLQGESTARTPVGSFGSRWWTADEGWPGPHILFPEAHSALYEAGDVLTPGGRPGVLAERLGCWELGCWGSR